MKRRHVLDKFGHSLSQEPMLSLALDESGSHYNADNKHVRFLPDPIEDHDAVTKSYLERFWERKIKELTESKSLRLNKDKTAWDAEGLKIINTAPGDKLTDVSTLEQACTYDEGIKSFRCGLKTYNLVENSANNPIVVTTRLSAFGPLELAEYHNVLSPIHPTNYAMWDFLRNELVYDKHNQLVWDEGKKKFCKREEASWYKKPTQPPKKPGTTH